MLPLTRREFLRNAGGLGFLAFSGMAPAFLTRSAMAGAPPPERDRTILVIIQLAGGNDGLNTVIPVHNDNYHLLRPNLALREGLLPLNDQLALHPSCQGLHALFNDGRLSIIQNVGYPNPNRSHFRSTEIWETATDGDTTAYEGWLGRYFDNTCAGSPGQADPCGIHVGDMIPHSYLSAKPHSLFGMQARGRFSRRDQAADTAFEKLLQTDHRGTGASYLQHTMMNTLVTERRVESVINNYKSAVKYPGNQLAQSLRRIAALIHADLETRVYFVSQGGYDTHANQLGNHARLLQDLSGAMHAFQQDLTTHKKDDQVLTMTFSEFGRRAAENGSAGTDHGTAAPLFVMGSKVQGGLHGTPPSLGTNPRQDPEYSTDFRSVYSSVLDRWLEADSTRILGRRFEPVPFI